MGLGKREPTVEELLSDPMMTPLFDHDRTTADDVRALMHEAGNRLARLRADGARAATESGEPDSDSDQRDF
jgi:hypothetical protein